METKDVRIPDVPEAVLDTVMQAARDNGVPSTAAAACRWALCQFARRVDDADEPRRSVGVRPVGGVR